MDKITARLLEEIEYTVATKLFNINNGTATQREKEIVQECLGFISIIKYSRLKPAEIKRIWDKTNLAYL